MRVLVLPSQYPGPNTGIGGVFVKDYAQLAVRRNDVRIAVLPTFTQTRHQTNGQSRIKHEHEGRVQVARIGLECPAIPALKAFWYLWLFAMLPRALRKLWPDWRPDLIHAHNAFPAGFLAMRLAKCWNVPFVLTEHTGPFSKQMRSWPKARLVRRVFNAAACATAVSHYQRVSIESCGIQSEIRVIPNPVNTRLFCPSVERGEVNRLVFIGLLHPGKGIDLLLQALSLDENRHWHLDIVGDGTHRDEFERLSERLGLRERVRFFGARQKEALPPFIRRATALILPSLQETFGIVLIEALACGRPVITTRCGGPQEFIASDLGVLVNPGSVEEISKALAEFVARRHEFLPERCAGYVRTHFSYEAVAEQLEPVYTTALQRHSNN